jgi:hypothetical protein
MGLGAMVWPVLAILVVGAAAGLAVWRATGDASVLRLAGVFTMHLLAGLLGSFVVHETGHLLALGRCQSVSAVVVERRLLRISLQPRGELLVGEACAVAVSGPGASATVGGILVIFARDLGIHYWYLAHLLFLIPPFGDGIAIVRSCGGFRRR